MPLFITLRSSGKAEFMVLRSYAGKFRLLWHRGFAVFIRRILKVPPRRLQGEEALSRFITQRSDYSPKHNKARPRAFVPFPHQALSVFRTSGLNEPAVWRIGEIFVSQPLERTLYGRAELTVEEISRAGLRLFVDDIPARHADVVGWPTPKDQQVAIAQELAAIARLHLACATIDS
jgi:hypothetical protein